MLGGDTGRGCLVKTWSKQVNYLSFRCDGHFEQLKCKERAHETVATFGNTHYWYLLEADGAVGCKKLTSKQNQDFIKP